MTPFKPVGDVARWKLIYPLLVACKVDEIVTYETLAEALSLDLDRDRKIIQMSMRRAAKEHEEVNKYAIEPLPNIGYRVVQPAEHLRLAQSQQKRAGRTLARGHSKAVNVDLNAIDNIETRKALELVGRAFAMQMEFNKRFDTRQNQLEQVLDNVNARTERTETELNELRARLARLEVADSSVSNHRQTVTLANP